MKKIIIVEDEIKLRNELSTFLQNNGFIVEIIEDFSCVIESLLKKQCDLILLDINLPGISGEYICQSIKKQINTPIIILTSKSTEIDELLCLNYGADDFITKPYSQAILLARINKVINNNNNFENQITYKNITLDISKSLIQTKDKCIDLSKNELKIFHYLLINKGKIISRDELMNYLWDSFEFVDDNTLTVNINRLRTKLDEIGLQETIITRRSQGYIIL